MFPCLGVCYKCFIVEGYFSYVCICKIKESLSEQVLTQVVHTVNLLM
jgi:hypothetical protein